MTPFDLDGLLTFLSRRWDDILELTIEHLLVVLLSLAIAMIIGIVVGMLTWDKPIPSAIVIGAAGVAITIPSLALLALLIRPFGLGWTSTVIALTFYSLLPIVRNTIVGLREVPASVLESAMGMGMGPIKRMLSIQLPIAWPIILTGARVAAQLTVGIAAIAAYVAGPGLGILIFNGLSSLGSKNALNLALTGTFCIIILALLLDAAFAQITRLTTSRGLRA